MNNMKEQLQKAFELIAEALKDKDIGCVEINHDKFCRFFTKSGDLYLVANESKEAAELLAPKEYGISSTLGISSGSWLCAIKFKHISYDDDSKNALRGSKQKMQSIIDAHELEGCEVREVK